MRLLRFRCAGLLLCVALAAASTAPSLLAQDDAPQRGGSRGMFTMGGNSAHGTVTAVSGNTITIKDEQGNVYKVETGPNTHFRKDREEARLADVHVGDVIVAAGNLDEQAKTVGAVFVVVLSPQQAAQMEKMRAEFGKTWTAGKVTAIKDLTVTIERPDKVSQTVAVDENTIFQKRGRGADEDITFPDIKVGDRLMARGALRNGSFLATNLTVAEPGQHGQGRWRQGGQGPQGQPEPQPEGAPSGSAPQQPPNLLQP